MKLTFGSITRATNHTLRHLIGIDLRSLALFRISIGLVLIADLINRSFSLTAHYTDQGVLPRRDFFNYFDSEKWYYSIHYLSGEPAIITILFIVAVLLAIGYTIGYRTRICAILSWILLVSLQNRNVIVLQGGDTYLRVLLFWSLFLPLNAKWSIDQWLSPHLSKKSDVVFSFGSLAIIMQIMSLYIFTGLLKTGDMWNVDFTAVYYALSLEQFTTPLGLQLLKFPEVMKLLTIGTIYLEKYGMLIFVIPFFIGRVRILGLILFISFHIGINSTMELGLFHYVCIAALFVFIPSWFWDHLTPKFNNFLSRFRGYVSIKGKLDAYLTYFVHWFSGQKTVAHESSLYRIIFKKLSHGTSQVLVLCLAVYLLLWNLRELDGSYGKYLSYDHNWIARVLRIDQRWDMFAPFPLTEDGWFVVNTTLYNGQQIDLFKGGKPVDYTKPEKVYAQYSSQRWRKYMMRLWERSYDSHRKYYLQYLCRQWNKDHDFEEEAMSVEMVFMLERTPLPGEPNPEPERVSLWSCSCDD